ncbi:MAG: GYF domain-containing protein [Puniceicoccaceae bacterium]
MSQFHIRPPDSETADGPFTFEQLKDLAESGVLKPDTLYLREGMDDFAPFSGNEELWNSLQPPKKAPLKLRPRRGEEPAATETAGKQRKHQPPAPSPTDESGDVGRMLAAAEGETDETRHIRKLRRSRQRAVAVLMPGLVLMLLGSVACLIQPHWEPLRSMVESGEYSFDLLFSNWILALALVDLFLAIAIGLGQTGLFPFLRLRAAVGIGFFLFIFYSRQEWDALAAITALQTGMIGATLCSRFTTTTLMVLTGLAGGGFLVWLTWFKGIAL